MTRAIWLSHPASEPSEQVDEPARSLSPLSLRPKIHHCTAGARDSPQRYLNGFSLDEVKPRLPIIKFDAVEMIVKRTGGGNHHAARPLRGGNFGRF